jgi:hypothetical protein
MTGTSLSGQSLSTFEQGLSALLVALPVGSAAYKLYSGLMAEAKAFATYGAGVGTETTVAMFQAAQAEASLLNVTTGVGVTNPLITRLPPPAVPLGVSRSQFGSDVIGWGSGESGTLLRLSEINPLTVTAMQQRGLTFEMAKEWRNFYANEFLRNANNATANARVMLMNSIINNWH